METICGMAITGWMVFAVVDGEADCFEFATQPEAEHFWDAHGGAIYPMTGDVV